MEKKTKFIWLMIMICYTNIAYSNVPALIADLSDKHDMEQSSDSVAKIKSQKSIKCIMMASAGLHNVIVDHYKDAIGIFVKNPHHENVILYQPESHAPDDYIKMMEDSLFTSSIWKSMENRLMAQGEKDFYTRIMYSFDKTGALREAGLLPSKDQWMTLFIIPNLRAVYVNNMYWESEWNGPRIEEEDIPLVISSIEFLNK